MEFKIGNVPFTRDRTVIIAEAGVNHLGRMDYAEELIRTAARAGADIVKFQTYKAEKLTTKNAPRFWNWDGEHDQGGSQFDSYAILDSFEAPQYAELIKLCGKYGVEFMSTPFDNDAVDMLVGLGMQGFKLASCDLTNIPLIEYMAGKGLPILISTGAAEIDEIRRAVETIERTGNRQICIMHCTLCYPTEPKDSNLSALKDIRRNFPDYLLGLSDHTLGTIVPAASVLYEARVIEKHYTFDKTLPDSADHWLSLSEVELAQLVRDVRILEQALGCGRKIKLDCETPAHQFARRSLVSAKDIKAGDFLTAEDMCCKRPGTGLSPEFLSRFVGRTATRDIPADNLLSLADVSD